MPVIQGLGWTFDTVAKTYEKLRPGYTKELYDTLFSYQPLCAGSKAVEVGIGGGQATEPILKTGCSVLAVEPGQNFCALCREKFVAYPGFSVLNGKFEDAELEKEQYDLVYSASAFHWVPEEVGYKKVFDCLKKGGTFARFANHPYKDKSRPGMHEALQESVEAIADAVHGVLERTPPELAADIFERGIVMTGGGSLLYGLDKLIQQKTGIHAMVAEDAVSCVAIGTGRYIEYI